MPNLERTLLSGTLISVLLSGAATAEEPSAGTAPEAAAPVTLPPVEVIAPSPLPGLGIDRDKVPSNARSLPAPEITTHGPTSFTTQLNQRVGSADIEENQGNPFQPDVLYRGFEGSPITGTPVGIAVYQNGVRVNEPFGDNINWDLIPDFAIDNTSVIPTNPIYGLNALGGAFVIGMKNGFNFHGFQGDVAGGSFGRNQVTMQYGQQVGNIGAYIGGNLFNEGGFRKLSPSHVRQLYADIGVESEHGSLHLGFTGANNALAGVGPTPIQLADIDRSAVFTSPQSFNNTLLMPVLNANYNVSDALSFQANFYYRGVTRKLLNGNTTDAKLCGDRTLLCFGDNDTPLIDTTGAQVPASVLGGGTPGENDRSSINSHGLGSTLQGTWTEPLFDHPNHLVFGASLDHASVNLNSTSELGIIDPISLRVSGVGVFIDQPDGSLAPVSLETTNNYYGFYASDTVNVTPELALTLGGRYNLALVTLVDKIGTALNGSDRFSRFNPSAGATYKITPNITGYFNFAQANRAPTPGEIACSDPTRPCLLDLFVTSDPAGLKQIAATTYETGLRGRFRIGASDTADAVDWNLGLFRTDATGEIFAVPSTIITSGFFQNVGDTRRQGIEAGISYHDDNWQAGVNYSFIDATFQSAFALSSPNNPFADDAGNIQIRPGNQLPGVPQHRLKVNVDYAVTDKWKVGGNLIYASSQFFFGDASNQNPKLPGYWFVDLHSSYQVTDNIELFAIIQNLFNNNYPTFGIFGDVGKTPLPGVANPSDPRFVTLAAPVSVFGGVRIRF
ncbi:MAG: TonB-dependent receptor [Alphaproteobacteria bacterium]|nr:TonB-dependent receptor [Alphaproteobacteria bacterium]